MRYIRFLKAPRIVSEKINFLITITSDLGDSFLPYDVTLFTELCSSNSGTVISTTKVEWTAGLRSLPITIALNLRKVIGPFFVRVGTLAKAPGDDFNGLFVPESRGVVSAFSSHLDPLNNINEAQRTIQRRFSFSNDYGLITSAEKINLKPVIDFQIWEEGGESIARHLWDAGIALSAQLAVLLSKTDSDPITKAFSPLASEQPLRVLELGTGCGIVGRTIAQIVPNADIVLTDLPEVQEVVSRNISGIAIAEDSSITFQELDWEAELPENLVKVPVDIAVAADCTYNPDSSPALVNTLSRLAKISPDIAVVIAMKIRHSSEAIFFDLMTDAGFTKIHSPKIPLPGDEESGEETVHIHLFRHKSHDTVSRARQRSFTTNKLATTKNQLKRRRSSTDSSKRARK